jgi:hypothetical protein
VLYPRTADTRRDGLNSKRSASIWSAIGTWFGVGQPIGDGLHRGLLASPSRLGAVPRLARVLAGYAGEARPPRRRPLSLRRSWRASSFSPMLRQAECAKRAHVRPSPHVWIEPHVPLMAHAHSSQASARPRAFRTTSRACCRGRSPAASAGCRRCRCEAQHALGARQLRTGTSRARFGWAFKPRVTYDIHEVARWGAGEMIPASPGRRTTPGTNSFLPAPMLFAGTHAARLLRGETGWCGLRLKRASAVLIFEVTFFALR